MVKLIRNDYFKTWKSMLDIDHYYRNLARVGMFYDELNYDKALPFLLMLPQALIMDN
jgi:hypothetical protein